MSFEEKIILQELYRLLIYNKTMLQIILKDQANLSEENILDLDKEINNVINKEIERVFEGL